MRFPKMFRARVLLLSLGVAALMAGVSAVLVTEQGYAAFSYVLSKLRGGYTVEERVGKHAAAVESRLKDVFAAAGSPYPPSELAYVAFKDTRRLEVYARTAANEPWRFIKAYAVLGQSGTLGPKLKEGDRQVPEGLYRAESLNPNSRFYLSIRLNYPNAFDQQMARLDGRISLGSDIMIHGTASSIGCLAVGNRAATDLFVLAALASKERVRIVVSPTDFRLPSAQAPAVPISWADELYTRLKNELSQYPRGT